MQSVVELCCIHPSFGLLANGSTSKYMFCVEYCDTKETLVI